MSNVDPLADLAIRKRQLETHLLQSHEYREKIGERLKLLAITKLAALVVFLGECFIYVREPKPGSSWVLAALAATLFVVLAVTYFIWRTWLCLSRLNERWLTPEAKRTIEALRLEQSRSVAKSA